MRKTNERKQIAKISVFITSIFVIFLSVTYAFINQTLVGTKRQVITSGNLELELLEDENNLAITDALPMYDEVGMIQDAFTFRLVNKTPMDTNYVLKLEEVTVDGGLAREDVKYGLTKDEEVTIDLVSNIVDNTIDEGVILGNQTIEYSLRLWVKDDVEDITKIQNKTMRLKLNMRASQKTEEVEEGVPVSDKAFASENLGDTCKTYDDGVDTFLVGQCSQNYVWYSGKLWRIVLKNNETGNIKMITDNNISAMAYSSSVGSLDYGSLVIGNYVVGQWLEQEFLPTLHNYNDYLVVDSFWDEKTEFSLSDPVRPNNLSLKKTVALLNAYEYYTVYGKSDGLATAATNYLKSNDNGGWWLMTPYPYESRKMSSVLDFGNIDGYSFSATYGVRPVVNLKSTVDITKGTGSIDDPYRLVGDEQETVNGITLLNTRYSGEYITFNNELYRIVGVEDGLVKITAVNVIENIEPMSFHNSSTATSFATSKVKPVLETYYQSLDDWSKNFIEPNTYWYLGDIEKDSSGGKNYKRTICKNPSMLIDAATCEKTTTATMANIGLPRYGEMFTSQITRGPKLQFWTLTPTDTAQFVLSVNESGYISNSSTVNKYSLRPSMYLKSEVRIANRNTGDGTYKNPYLIEMDGFQINTSAKYTAKSTVTLDLYGNKEYKVCISNAKECTNYENFSNTKSWTLTSGDGEKTVYVYYKNQTGEIVGEFSQTIILDENPPINNSIQVSSEDSIFRNLTLSSTGADYMCISNTSANINDCTIWKDYTTTYDWVLSSGNGEKTIYAFFKDKAGNTASASSKFTCNNCDVIIEDFFDTDYHDQLTVVDGSTYPWIVRNGRFISNNKGQKSSSSISTIIFTLNRDSKLSFDYGVSSESGYDKLTITLKPNEGAEKKLVNAISGVRTGKITDEPLTAGITYTLTLTYSKDSSGNQNEDIGYIDNLMISP